MVVPHIHLESEHQCHQRLAPQDACEEDQGALPGLPP